MITKDMTIGEVIKMKANAPEILMGFGMGCVGCPSAQGETLEEAAFVHGLNPDDIVSNLNEYLDKGWKIVNHESNEFVHTYILGMPLKWLKEGDMNDE